MNTTNTSALPAAIAPPAPPPIATQPQAIDVNIDIGIGGMTCASCVARVEKAIKKVPGVQGATVNLATESARITLAADDHAEARLRRAIRDAGYEPKAADAAIDAPEASPWAGFMPVSIGLALSLLTDPALDVLITDAAPFADLPAVLARLAASTADATLCQRIDYS